MRASFMILSVALGLASIPAAAAWASPPAPAADEPPWLGVVISDGIHGVRIREIIPQAPADDAGLEPGDEIIEVSGTRVTTVTALQATIGARQVSDKVALTVWRNGAPVTVTTVLTPRLSAGEILHRRLVGKPAPAFGLPSVTDAQIRALDNIRGRVVVVEFFATNCDECAPIHGRLSRLVDQRGRDGLTVLAVSREPHSMLDAWTRRMVPSFGVLHDRNGHMASAYRIERVPAIVVINRDGEVCYAGIGGKDNLEHAIFAAERALRRSASYWSR